MKPPALATWFLHRFGLPESLVGDLIEQFQHRRSWVWYWRQVLSAIVVGCVKDIGEHKLLAARALGIGWVIYFLTSFPINWLARTIRYQIEDWLAYTGHYSFWGVFWSGQLPGHVLVCIGCGVSGWIVARLHAAQSAAIVCLYSLSVLFVEYGLVSWMFLRYGHPPMSSVALIAPAVLLIGRPLSILTPIEVAELLRTTRKAIYSMVERRQLPGIVRIGRRVLLREDALVDWLGQKSTPSLER